MMSPRATRGCRSGRAPRPAKEKKAIEANKERLGMLRRCHSIVKDFITGIGMLVSISHQVRGESFVLKWVGG